MTLFAAIVKSLLLLIVAAFCLFGFLATYEPTTNPAESMAFRIGYAAIGVGCIITIGFWITRALRR